MENVLEVFEKPWLERSGQKFLGFKVVTLVPFETNLIKFELMSPQQVSGYAFSLIKLKHFSVRLQFYIDFNTIWSTGFFVIFTNKIHF